MGIGDRVMYVGPDSAVYITSDDGSIVYWMDVMCKYHLFEVIELKNGRCVGKGITLTIASSCEYYFSLLLEHLILFEMEMEMFSDFRDAYIVREKLLK